MGRVAISSYEKISNSICKSTSILRRICGNQNGKGNTPIAKSYDSADFVVTADQVSETYTVASVASAVNLPSTSVINENYFAVNNLYTATGTVASDTGAAIEKPVTIDISNLSRGIIVYEVKDRRPDRRFLHRKRSCQELG